MPIRGFDNWRSVLIFSVLIVRYIQNVALSYIKNIA